MIDFLPQLIHVLLAKMSMIIKFALKNANLVIDHRYLPREIIH